MTLGTEIRSAREAAGLTLRALARRIEISPSYLCDIETDRRAPALDTLDAIMAAVGRTSERERWMALCGRVPDDITAALLAWPSRWDEVRALLARSDDGEG